LDHALFLRYDPFEKPRHTFSDHALAIAGRGLLVIQRRQQTNIAHGWRGIRTSNASPANGTIDTPSPRQFASIRAGQPGRAKRARSRTSHSANAVARDRRSPGSTDDAVDAPVADSWCRARMKAIYPRSFAAHQTGAAACLAGRSPNGLAGNG